MARFPGSKVRVIYPPGRLDHSELEEFFKKAFGFRLILGKPSSKDTAATRTGYPLGVNPPSRVKQPPKSSKPTSTSSRPKTVQPNPKQAQQFSKIINGETRQVTKWRNIPETSREFCSYWKTHSLGPKERKRLFDLLYVEAKVLGFDEDLVRMTPDLLMRLFALVDTMWLGGLVGRTLVKRSIQTSCGTSPNPRDKRGRTAGFCRIGFVNHLAASLRINMCRPVLCHPNLFKKPKSPRAYEVGGILCSSPLRCMLQVFVHEFVHALVGIFCVEKAHHGPRFRRILKAMFGQTTHVAGLARPLTHQAKDVHVDEASHALKKLLKRGSKVSFHTSGHTKTKRGVVLGLVRDHKKGKDMVRVQHKTKIYTLPLFYLTLV
jgi:hypothetical protein